jgi:hypothetical protein
LDQAELVAHSFVLKIWQEETTEESGRAAWRGRITHVASGESRYVQTLEDVTSFVVMYLSAMGVRPSIGCRMLEWLNHLVHC